MRASRATGLSSAGWAVQGTSAPNLTLEMLPVQLPPEVNALHVGTLGLVLEPMASTLVELVRRERDGRLIMLDPNVRVGIIDEAEYRDRMLTLVSESTIVKASNTDLAWLYPDGDYKIAVDQILGSGVKLAVVTLGAIGAFAGHRDLRVRVPAPPVDVVDTIGAGDAFGAALLAWLYDHAAIRPDLSLEPEELNAALAYARLAASLTCARAGADPPTKAEMLEFST